MKSFPLSVVLILVLLEPVSADVLHVPDDYPQIQAAIEAAGSGDTVLIADGTFTGPGNKNLDFLGKPITVASENGAACTTIDCEWDGRGFLVVHQEGRDSVIQGVEIHRAHYSDPASGDYGAGICLDDSSPTILDCIFRENRIVSASTQNGGGAGIGGSGSPLISGCQFLDNQVHSYGGGILLCLAGSEIEITNCLFQGNVAYRGGGMSLRGNGRVQITDCLLLGNQATRSGGGIHLHDVQDPGAQVSNCQLRQNVVDGYDRGTGGGIYSADSSLTMWECSLDENHSCHSGGGLSTLLADSQLFNCILIRNSAGVRGGALRIEWGFGGVTNCLFTLNQAERGAAVDCHWCGGLFQSCSMVDNGPGAECFLTSSANPLITDSILWNTEMPEVTCSTQSPSEPAEPTFRYCDIQGGYSGEENLDQDPMFVEGPGGDHYLSQLAAGQEIDSPCLDRSDSLAMNVVLEIPGCPITQGEQTTRIDHRGDEDLLDLGYHYPEGLQPTPSPSPSSVPTGSPVPSPTSEPASPSPTPSPNPWSGTRLHLPGSPFSAGDRFRLDVECWAAGEIITPELYIVLEQDGSYWFWPGWTPEVSSDPFPTLDEGPTTMGILDFVWPEGVGQPRYGLRFHACIVVPGTVDLIGTYDSVEFGHR